MSFYRKDNPEYLEQAFQSLSDQSYPATEIVLIQDGEIGDELDKVIADWETKLPIRKLINEENLGLGLSLKKGLESCTYELVARMDADDICHPERFSKQVQFMEDNPEISVVGSWIAEFSSSPDDIKSYRKLPSDHSDLFDFAKMRCPLNHPTVMYRRSVILNVGGYQDFRFQQDYHLWGRILNAGHKIANIPEPLLYMRVDENLFNRRGGVNYFQIENQVQRTFLEIGFINRAEYIRNFVIRGSVRLIPNSIRKTFYQLFLR